MRNKPSIARETMNILLTRSFAYCVSGGRVYVESTLLSIALSNLQTSPEHSALDKHIAKSRSRELHWNVWWMKEGARGTKLGWSLEKTAHNLLWQACDKAQVNCQRHHLSCFRNITHRHFHHGYVGRANPIARQIANAARPAQPVGSQSPTPNRNQ